MDRTVHLAGAALETPLVRTDPDVGETARAPQGKGMDAGQFAALYDEHVAFIHRNVRRLGVSDSAVEDVVQEIFLTAYRRYPSFRGDSSVRSWLFGILLRVVRLHRRTTVRAGLHGVIDRTGATDAERVADTKGTSPESVIESRDAWRLVLRILDTLDDQKREIFVLAELEEMPMSEIATLLDLKVNTAYSRLRLARAAFEAALQRIQGSP